MTNSTVPLPMRVVFGLKMGWESASIANATTRERKINNHSGVRAAVSSPLRRPKRNWIAGKSMSVGAGGVIRISHTRAGSKASASRIHGLANARLPRISTAAPG